MRKWGTPPDGGLGDEVRSLRCIAKREVLADREQQNVDLRFSFAFCSFLPRPCDVLLDQCITMNDACRSRCEVLLDGGVICKDVCVSEEERDDSAFGCMAGLALR
jgi:hypothetical protein